MFWDFHILSLSAAFCLKIIAWKIVLSLNILVVLQMHFLMGAIYLSTNYKNVKEVIRKVIRWKFVVQLVETNRTSDFENTKILANGKILQNFKFKDEMWMSLTSAFQHHIIIFFNYRRLRLRKLTRRFIVIINLFHFFLFYFINLS